MENFLGFSTIYYGEGGLKLSQLFWNSNMVRILGTPCNKLGVNVFSFSPPLTSVPRSLFRGFSSHFRTPQDFLVPEKMWADHTEISNEYL